MTFRRTVKSEDASALGHEKLTVFFGLIYVVNNIQQFNNM